MLAGNKKKKSNDSRAYDRKVSRMLGYSRWMRDAIWKAGDERIIAEDVKKKREDAQNRLKRKRDLKRETEKLLLEQKQEQDFQTERNVDVPCWNQFIMDSFPDYYL